MVERWGDNADEIFGRHYTRTGRLSPVKDYDNPYQSFNLAAISISKLPFPADSNPTFR